MKGHCLDGSWGDEPLGAASGGHRKAESWRVVCELALRDHPLGTGRCESSKPTPACTSCPSPILTQISLLSEQEGNWDLRLGLRPNPTADWSTESVGPVCKWQSEPRGPAPTQLPLELVPRPLGPGPSCIWDRLTWEGPG